MASGWSPDNACCRRPATFFWDGRTIIKDTIIIFGNCDMKMTINVENMPKEDWVEYLDLCGWTLARAHGRTSDAAQIAGYLGRSEVFDKAVARFALAYADQTQRDYEVFGKAIRSGRIKASANASS